MQKIHSIIIIILLFILIIFYKYIIINTFQKENFSRLMYSSHVIKKKIYQHSYLKDYSSEKYIIFQQNKFYLNINKENSYKFGIINTKAPQWRLFNTLGNKTFFLDIDSNNLNNYKINLIDNLKTNINQYVYYSNISQIIYSFTFYGIPVYLYIKADGNISWTYNILLASQIVFND